MDYKKLSEESLDEIMQKLRVANNLVLPKATVAVPDTREPQMFASNSSSDLSSGVSPLSSNLTISSMRFADSSKVFFFSINHFLICGRPNVALTLLYSLFHLFEVVFSPGHRS